jgi:Fe-S-cluster containining protein
VHEKGFTRKPMKRLFESIMQHAEKEPLWLDRLAAVFKTMDAGYEQTAGCHKFVCNGCEDNCCRTQFYHHTLLEYMAIHQGYTRLAPQERERVYARAVEYCRQPAGADDGGTRVKPWCPLNDKGRCLVYDLRPMICRLHGIPHMLQQPGGRTVQGPGCAYFMTHHPADEQAPLDRTPFYKEMSGLEKKFRAELSVNVKFKHTIAEMILSFHSDDAAEYPDRRQGVDS